MGRTVEITCDGCGHDLTVTHNIEDYRLVLASEGKPGYGPGVYTCVAISPPVDRAYYFCGLKCLDHWRGRVHHEAGLWRAWREKWNAEHRSKEPAGWVGIDMRPFYSYEEPPKEMRDALAAEFKAAALAAFPLKD